MKRSRLLNLSVIMFLLMGVSFLGEVNEKKILAASYEKVTSPSLECSEITYLQNDEGKTSFGFYATKKDKNLTVKVIDVPILEDEVLFAVFIDPKKGIIGNNFLEKTNSSAQCSYTTPFYSDYVDVHIYKQKKNEPAYTIKKENFIGHSKFFMARNSIFYRPNGSTEISSYDSHDAPTTFAGNHLTRLTPNFYSLEGAFTVVSKDYAEIVLPQDKADLLTDDEKIIIPNFYTINGETGENVVELNSYCLDFYLPEGIDEFTIKYHEFDGDVEIETYSFYIKLNK